MEKYKLLHGDCIDKLKELDSDSVCSIVTDPPAGISFMYSKEFGRTWDSDKGGRDKWIKWMQSIAEECLRALKPGGHALVWALPRTSHWTATAWENAGFEVRDIVHHIFGGGFPKSLNISKAIDKQRGLEREIVGKKKTRQPTGNAYAQDKWTKEHSGMEEIDITAPACKESEYWSGWYSAIKPAVEQRILLRKPLAEKTIAENVLKYGTGGLNIDQTRVEYDMTNEVDNRLITGESNVRRGKHTGKVNLAPDGNNHARYNRDKGRYPSNFIHDGSEEVKSCFPETKTGECNPKYITKKSDNRCMSNCGKR